MKFVHTQHDRKTLHWTFVITWGGHFLLKYLSSNKFSTGISITGISVSTRTQQKECMQWKLQSRQHWEKTRDKRRMKANSRRLLLILDIWKQHRPNYWWDRVVADFADPHRRKSKWLMLSPPLNTEVPLSKALNSQQRQRSCSVIIKTAATLSGLKHSSAEKYIVIAGLSHFWGLGGKKGSTGVSLPARQQCLIWSVGPKESAGLRLF